MKKFTTYLIIISMLVTFLPQELVSAKQNTIEEKISVTEVATNLETEYDLNEELGVEDIDGSLETHVEQADEVGTIESTLETKELYINSLVELDFETGEISAIASLKDEYGNEIEKKFGIYITDYQGGNLQALFVDKETGEEYTVNDNELSASALPLVGVLVSFIAKQGLKKAIKKWGPSAVSTLIRSSETVAKEVAKSLGYAATKSVSHGAKVYRNKKGKPEYITRDRDGHNGGVWKGASSIKNLGSKKTRSGTYNAELKRIGD